MQNQRHMNALMPSSTFSAMVCGLLLAFGTWSASRAQQSYFLNGSAQAVGDICYQLTAAVNTQNGTVWYANPLDLTQPFDLQFTMNFGTNDANGADGMVFVLQTAGTNAIGESGGGIGFNGFDPSFGVEFDTWQNNKYGDPFGDHIAFVSNGFVSHNAPTALGGPVLATANGSNIEDGQDHVVSIQWSPAESLVTVFFDCEERLSAEVDLIGSIFGGETEVTFGFTGSTGGASNNQTVCLQDNIITTGPDVFLCPGDSTTLSVVGLPESIFTWSPVDGLDDPSSPTPVCSPTETTTYVVTYDSYCNGTIEDSITVVVEPIAVEVTPAPPFVLNCIQTDIDIAGVSNFTVGAAYEWTTTDGNIVNQAGPFATIDAPGSYAIEASAIAGGCSDVFEFVVEEDLTEVAIDLTAPSEVLTCTDTLIEVSGTTDIFAPLAWAGSASFSLIDDATAAVSGPGTIVASAVHPTSGCSSSAELEVAQDITLPLVNAGTADSLTCLSPTAVVTGIAVSPAGYTPLLTWSWDAASDQTMNPFDPFSPVVGAAGDYLLEVSFVENGCTGNDVLTVFSAVPPPVNISSVTMPNVITPNNDGKNDGLALFLADEPDRNLMALIDDYHLRVYNRWGGLVYENTGLPIRWQGTQTGGQPLAEGTYYIVADYRITCGGLQEGSVQNHLQLLRSTP